jgi:hypothetical protein
MNRRVPIHKERDAVSFALYLYPFEAVNVAPGDGGGNIEQVHVDGHGIEIAKRSYPTSWNMVSEDALWWITLEQSWLQNRDLQVPSNATPYEVEFLVTALNLCVNTKVFFARFARREYQGIIHDGKQIRPSSGLQVAEILERPLPDTLVIDATQFTTVVDRLFEDVLLIDEHTDLSKAVESYRAAVQSFHTEIHVRLLYSVCENALFDGYPDSDQKDTKIAKISSLDCDEAEAWRHLVNRTKHPDEGTSHTWEATFEEVPPPVELRMREAANEAILRQLLTG